MNKKSCVLSNQTAEDNPLVAATPSKPEEKPPSQETKKSWSPHVAKILDRTKFLEHANDTESEEGDTVPPPPHLTDN